MNLPKLKSFPRACQIKYHPNWAEDVDLNPDNAKPKWKHGDWAGGVGIYVYQYLGYSQYHPEKGNKLHKRMHFYELNCINCGHHQVRSQQQLNDRRRFIHCDADCAVPPSSAKYVPDSPRRKSRRRSRVPKRPLSGLNL